MSRVFKEKECKLCGKFFVPTSPNQSYCSDECKKQKKSIYNKKYWQTYYQTHKNTTIKEYNKTKRKKVNHKEQYSKYKDYYKEYHKQWYNSHKDFYKNLIYQKRINDKNYKLTEWIRKQVYRCLKSNKDKHTFDILGYTPQQLRQHIENQFKHDMNWDNYGTLWHIDHIKPLCAFKFMDSENNIDYEQIKIANSLENLQPLYATENLSKGGKF